MTSEISRSIRACFHSKCFSRARKLMVNACSFFPSRPNVVSHSRTVEGGKPGWLMWSDFFHFLESPLPQIRSNLDALSSWPS